MPRFFPLCLLLSLGCLLPSLVSAQDFSQQYERGKLLLRQKLYVDAVKELYIAVNKIDEGKRHFGANYYLGLAYYRMGNITQAMVVFARAKTLIKNQTQRDSLQTILKQIASLFGQLRIVLEVDPDEVGPLKLLLIPKQPFSHEQKQRTYNILQSIWRKQGVKLSGTPLYLPKGEYDIKIDQPQCLRYGFTLGEALVSELTVADQATSLALKEKVSCKCEGGQEVREENKKRFCACPKGTAWSSVASRCEIPKIVDNRSWIAKNWPWILVIAVVGVGGAVTAVVLATTLPNGQRDLTLSGPNGGSILLVKP